MANPHDPAPADPSAPADSARLSDPGVITVDSRFNGPPTSGNGGYVAGLLAARAPGGLATVTLRQPPPLDRELKVVREDAAEGTRFGLYDADVLLAEAVPFDAAAAAAFEPVEPVPFAVAEESSAAFFAGRDAARNPYPTCFVCGTQRAEGDGLRLFPGLLPQRPDTTACPWVPDASLAGPDGTRVRPEFVWAALDCPGGWTALGTAVPMVVLGRMTTRIDALPDVGDRCVLMGRLLGREGRKVHTATTLYDGDGRVAAHADAVWIVPRTAADA